MAAYTLDLEAAADAKKIGGRRAFPKELKIALLERDGEGCAICGAPYPAQALQIDHRVPYEVVGEVPEIDPTDFMLVCGSCNRAKSWSCEHCENWTTVKDPRLCVTCLWASPEEYEHIALEQRRSLTVTWVGDDVDEHDSLAEQAAAGGVDLREFVKATLRRLADES